MRFAIPNKLNKNIALKGGLIVSMLVSTIFAAGLVYAGPGPFQGGDIFKATNNTKQAPGWTDPLTNVDPGNVVQFSVMIVNTGDATATNTSVAVTAPGADATSHSVGINVSSDNAATVGDNVTVSGPSSFHFNGLVANDTIVFSPACPAGCLVADTINSGGVNIGNVEPVSTSGNNVAVTFKLYTAPAAAPAPSPSASPSVAPSPSTAPQQGGVVSCPAGTTQTVSGNTIICIQNQQQQTQTVTQSNNQNVNVTQTAAAQPAVAGAVTTLPKTGLPLTALVGLGGLPLGILLRKFSKGPSAENDPDSIWEDRQIRLDSSD